MHNRCTRTNEEWGNVLTAWARRGMRGDRYVEASRATDAGRRPELGALSPTAVGLLTSVVSEIEVRSAYSPPQKIRVADLVGGPAGPPNPYVRLTRPTVILRGPGVGTQVVAPGGEASPDEWRRNLAVAGVARALAVGGAGAVAFGLGAAHGRRRARRTS